MLHTVQEGGEQTEVTFMLRSCQIQVIVITNCKHHCRQHGWKGSKISNFVLINMKVSENKDGRLASLKLI